MFEKLRAAMRTAVSAGLAGLLAASIAGVASAQEYVGRLSHHWGTSHHSAIFAQKYAEEVTKRSNGRLRIEVYPSGQLYGIRETLGALKTGAVEIGGIVGSAAFLGVEPNYAATLYPYLFRDFDDIRGFLQEDPVGKKVWNNILEKSGAINLMYNPVGPSMQFSAGFPLDSIKAYEGHKARSLYSADRARWHALGAGTISLPTREVYQGLQNGMVDIVGTVPPAIEAYSWWEFLDHGQLPYLLYGDAYMLANKMWFAQLPKDLQNLLMEVGEELGNESTEKVVRAAADVLEKWKARGAKVYTLTDQQLDEMMAIVEKDVRPEFVKTVDPAVLDAAMAYVKARHKTN
jgi:TRAP-type C4-dicarboxylate transport system substrate-binding protein